MSSDKKQQQQHRKNRKSFDSISNESNNNNDFLENDDFKDSKLERTPTTTTNPLRRGGQNNFLKDSNSSTSSIGEKTPNLFYSRITQPSPQQLLQQHLQQFQHNLQQQTPTSTPTPTQTPTPTPLSSINNNNNLNENNLFEGGSITDDGSSFTTEDERTIQGVQNSMRENDDDDEEEELEEEEKEKERREENQSTQTFEEEMDDESNRMLMLNQSASLPSLHHSASFSSVSSVTGTSNNLKMNNQQSSLQFNSFLRSQKAVPEILQMIMQFLEEEGYEDTVTVLEEESRDKIPEEIRSSLEPISGEKVDGSKMKKLIMDGEWTEVQKLSEKNTSKSWRYFSYCVAKQQYLELIAKQETEKALTFLTKKLKTLEGKPSNPEEFRDLCYLLACKSVHDVPTFKNWDLIHSREELFVQYQAMILFERTQTIPADRLTILMRQALSFQIENSVQNANKTGNASLQLKPKITSLLKDYEMVTVPTKCKRQFKGHKDNVKCVAFVGDNHDFIASGSSDNMMKLWDVKSGKLIKTAVEHSSRIWDLSVSKQYVATASGDSTVKLWSISDSNSNSVMTLTGSVGDVYSVCFHPGQNHLVCGGYDRNIRLFDIRNGSLKKTFVGHNSSVSSCIFNPYGNLLISGSKDATIRFWDILSGICLNTIKSPLSEVTSLSTNSSGSYLLSASKDNSNRLWDVRTVKPIRKFKGHSNTYKNFIRCGFGSNESVVIGGSEDGFIYIWDLASEKILEKLKLHNGVVYNTIWSSKQQLVASCSEDSTFAIWT